jgi:hypothetical protein
MFLLFLAATTAPLPPQNFVSESLLRVQVLADNGLPGERPVKPGRPFYAQQITFDGFLEFSDREQEKEARRRYDMDMSDNFSLTEWIGVLAKDGSRHHKGWLYCVRRSRFGTEKCFRDSDADGTFDQLTTLDPDQPDRFIKFDEIPPIAYRYTPRERKPISGGTYRKPEVYLSYDLVNGKLEFRVLAYTGLSSTVDFGPLETVDPESLPQTVYLAGARVKIVSWDGKRATLAVETPMSTSAVRFIAPDDRYLFGGIRKGWSLDFVEAPLPAR